MALCIMGARSVISVLLLPLPPCLHVIGWLGPGGFLLIADSSGTLGTGEEALLAMIIIQIGNKSS